MALRPSTSWVLAAVIAFGAGLTTMGVTNYAVYLGDLAGFWGAFFGSFVAVISFGLVLAVTSTSKQGALVGRVFAAIACFLFAAMVAWWIAAWGVSLFSLEGAWLWPLGVVAAAAAVLILRTRRSS